MFVSTDHSKMDSTDEDTQTTTAAQTDDDDDDGQTQESIMASTTVNGTPFSVLMSQAIKMKSAQEAPTRSKYDTYPTFYKNSIFPYEEVINARKKTFGGRMNDALELKEAGNKAFEEKRYLDAIHRYEMTLSVFKYLNNTNDNWKTEVRRLISYSAYFSFEHSINDLTSLFFL